jgi:hypothetical protein
VSLHAANHGSHNQPTNMNIEINNRVQHMANPSNYAPLFGTVIQIKDKRAQVAWEGKNQNKTWIKFESLKVIDDGWRETPNMPHTAARTITLADGTVYRQYRK